LKGKTIMVKAGLNFILFLASAIIMLIWITGCTPKSYNSTGDYSSPVSIVFTSDNNTLSTNSAASKEKFILGSPEVKEGGMLPREYTCDGNSSTLPLEWSGTPAGTQSLALIMHTIPGPNESHWYWVLYDIYPEIYSLVKNAKGIGTLGNNSVNRRTEYAPPCSKGPGLKLYTYTIYALSAPAQVNVPPAAVSRDVLLSAIKDLTIGRAMLNVYFER
jgi:phosphatidylethanolamine-binding protein (PEBP) family uncharacterized protein